MKIPTTAKELAAQLGTDAYNLRKQLLAANGQINFDKETDTLTNEQLAVWLPRYLQGKSKLSGEKLATVEQLLAALTNGTPKQITNEKTTESRKEPTEQLQPKKQPAKAKPTETANETTKQPTFKWISLVVAISAVFWQSAHFAHLEQLESPFSDGFKVVASWGIAIGFESLALLLTVVSDKGSRATWFWLLGFGLVAFGMNLSFYNCFAEVSFTKVVLSFALPFSIVATTHLFIKNNK